VWLCVHTALYHWLTLTAQNSYGRRTKGLSANFNPLLILFKALLHGQKDRIFLNWAFNLHTKTSALERLGRHGTFKSRALWSVSDSKGLSEIYYETIDEYVKLETSRLVSKFYLMVCEIHASCVNRIGIQLLNRQHCLENETKIMHQSLEIK
jgi:hypothetical protein